MIEFDNKELELIKKAVDKEIKVTEGTVGDTMKSIGIIAKISVELDNEELE